MSPLVFRRQAGRDLGRAYSHYEDQRAGLGEEFLGAVDSSLDAIERYPEMFARVRGEVRRALVTRFPYAIFYRIEPGRMVVFRVLHTARDARVWPK